MMFSPFLSCRTFGFLESRVQDPELAVARQWSGQDSLVPSGDGIITWSRPTRITISRDEWFSEPGPIQFNAQNAVVRLGALDNGTRVFAFVSPLSVVAASFKKNAFRYLQRGSERERQIVVTDFTLNLDQFVRESWTSLVGRIRSLEGITPDGLHVTLAASKGFPDRPPGFDFASILMDTDGQHRAKINGEFKIELADVSAKISTVASSLETIFNDCRGYLTPKRQLVGSAHL